MPPFFGPVSRFCPSCCCPKLRGPYLGASLWAQLWFFFGKGRSGMSISMHRWPTLRHDVLAIKYDVNSTILLVILAMCLFSACALELFVFPQCRCRMSSPTALCGAQFMSAAPKSAQFSFQFAGRVPHLHSRKACRTVRFSFSFR